MGNGTSDKKIAEQLAEFIVGQKYEDLPAETIEKAKEYIIDCSGCIVGAGSEPQARALLEVMQAEGGNPLSSVFGNGFKTSVMNAAMLNGTMGHIFDYDDDHREGTMHPTVAVFPGVFALGEKLKVDGKHLLRSLILGLEVMIRVGESYLGKSYYQGFHPTGTCGIYGSAAGCAMILGLDALQTTYALGIAGSFAAGTLEWRTEGSWQKPLQAGHPAMLGVLAASLAQKNFIGARTIFDGPDGVIRAFSHKDQFDYSRITETLGKQWEMKDTSIKVHACCRFGAPVADCALELYRQGVRAENVKEILAKVGDFTVRVLCTPPERKMRPKTHVDGQFSLPYTAAVAICKNRTGVDEFKVEALDDPEVLALMDKIKWEIDPSAEAFYPKAYPATLIATLNDGQTFETHVDFPKGDPENPATFDEIVTKFDSLTHTVLDEDRRKNIVQAVKGLDEMDDISELADLLR
ncbi:MmgE/PrpD family protein [Thermodesulfobacteriota bacterium]